MGARRPADPFRSDVWGAGSRYRAQCPRARARAAGPAPTTISAVASAASAAPRRPRSSHGNDARRSPCGRCRRPRRRRGSRRSPSRRRTGDVDVVSKPCSAPDSRYITAIEHGHEPAPIARVASIEWLCRFAGTDLTLVPSIRPRYHGGRNDVDPQHCYVWGRSDSRPLVACGLSPRTDEIAERWTDIHAKRAVQRTRRQGHDCHERRLQAAPAPLGSQINCIRKSRSRGRFRHLNSRSASGLNPARPNMISGKLWQQCYTRELDDRIDSPALALRPPQANWPSHAEHNSYAIRL